MDASRYLTEQHAEAAGADELGEVLERPRSPLGEADEHTIDWRAARAISIHPWAFDLRPFPASIECIVEKRA